MDNKTCKVCHQDKDKSLFRSLFGRNKIANDNWKSSICIECENARKREHYKKNAAIYIERVKIWRANNPNSRRNQWLKEKFGISQADYEILLNKQNGVCAICKQTDTKNLAVDHDHTTNKIRGLLCSKCNTALGLVKDNTTTLETMISYLQKSI